MSITVATYFPLRFKVKREEYWGAVDYDRMDYHRGDVTATVWFDPRRKYTPWRWAMYYGGELIETGVEDRRGEAQDRIEAIVHDRGLCLDSEDMDQYLLLHQLQGLNQDGKDPRSGSADLRKPAQQQPSQQRAHRRTVPQASRHGH